MGSADFTTVEVWTPWGLETYYILAVMKLSTRKVEIAGITPNPDGAWMQQMGRNLMDCYDGFLLDTRYLILDRDTKFLPMCGVLEAEDIEVVSKSKLKCVYGTIHANAKIRMFEQDDFLRRKDTEKRYQRVRRALPCRTKPSRCRKQHH